ncbi:MAG: stage 0 sporulation family protein [Anaerolineae bacterium]|nr:stage 0 sporulation family protein [Anaerolineae bacterium]
MQVVGIRFRNSAKVYYFAPGDIKDLSVDEYVIVETSRGQEAGQIAFTEREVSEGEIHGTLKKIIRQATAVDLTQMEKYHQQESDALRRCQDQARAQNLPMKVIRAEYNFDGSHLTFYFTAEQRVDFRELVKDLAREFRTRIELRQVGVRDDVKLLGGYGRCGRPHCCAMWLTDFAPISIRMAKQQDLPLSPMEISGACGRLLCCLAYENDLYEEIKRAMPRVGRTIQTPSGEGHVVALNVLQNTVTVELPNEVQTTFELDELEAEPLPDAELKPRRKRGTHKKN